MRTNQQTDVIENVPRANTQKGVNRLILKELVEAGRLRPGATVLDIPCGQGEWLTYLRDNFDPGRLVGIDIRPPEGSRAGLEFMGLDASAPFAESLGVRFDIITCISGVMAFDNISLFLDQLHRLLKDDGKLYLTNDNVWTLRDRLSYLFFGRLRRFKLCFEPDEGNWKILPLPTLVLALERRGFRIRRIRYTAVYQDDFLLAPLALLIYPLQWLYLYLTYRRKDYARDKWPMMYPFKALLARHYVIEADRQN